MDEGDDSNGVDEEGEESKEDEEGSEDTGQGVDGVSEIEGGEQGAGEDDKDEENTGNDSDSDDDDDTAMVVDKGVAGPSSEYHIQIRCESCLNGQPSPRTRRQPPQRAGDASGTIRETVRTFHYESHLPLTVNDLQMLLRCAPPLVRSARPVVIRK
jgi:hypothetical protein